MGGFVAGFVLIRFFVDRELVGRRRALGDARLAFTDMGG